MASLNRIIDVSISRATRTASRRSFGSVLIAAYHAVYNDRVREYEEPSEMLDDGFDASHPAYLAAISLCAQNPRVPRFKVGRRAGTPTQTVNLTPVLDLSRGNDFYFTFGGIEFRVTADSNPTIAEITAAFVAKMSADDDAIIASGVSSSTSAQDILPVSYNGVMGDTPSPARNVTLTLNNHADWDATTATVYGTDANGRAISEDFAIPNSGNTTLTGAKVFASITKIHIPAQSGSGGTLKVGVGVKFANADLVFTVTDHATYFSVANTNAGDWFAYSGFSINLEFSDQTAEPGSPNTIADDLDAIQASDPDFVGLIVADAQSKAQIEKVATWAEDQEVLYCAHTLDTNCENGTDTDVLSSLLASGRLHTVGFYSRVNHGKFPDAAVFGVIFPLDIGAATFAFKALSGCSPDDLSATALTRLIGEPGSPVDSLRALVYTDVLPVGTKIGTSITLGGMTSGAEWADNILGIFFIKSVVQDRAFNVLLQSPKLPFTAGGLDAFVGAVRAALKSCTRLPNPILDPDTLVVEGTKIQDVSDSDKQARFYDGVRFDARFQGAVHGAKIRGTIRA